MLKGFFCVCVCVFQSLVSVVCKIHLDKCAAISENNLYLNSSMVSEYLILITQFYDIIVDTDQTVGILYIAKNVILFHSHKQIT